MILWNERARSNFEDAPVVALFASRYLSYLLMIDAINDVYIALVLFAC